MSDADADRPIVALRNLGPRMATVLSDIDVRSEGELRSIGAAKAFARIRLTTEHSVTLNALYAMHAALEDCDWRAVDKATKALLRREAGVEQAPPTR